MLHTVIRRWPVSQIRKHTHGWPQDIAIIYHLSLFIDAIDTLLTHILLYLSKASALLSAIIISIIEGTLLLLHTHTHTIILLPLAGVGHYRYGHMLAGWLPQYAGIAGYRPGILPRSAGHVLRWSQTQWPSRRRRRRAAAAALPCRRCRCHSCRCCRWLLLKAGWLAGVGQLVVLAVGWLLLAGWPLHINIAITLPLPLPLPYGCTLLLLLHYYYYYYYYIIIITRLLRHYYDY
jgi:hypothetical protein